MKQSEKNSLIKKGTQRQRFTFKKVNKQLISIVGTSFLLLGNYALVPIQVFAEETSTNTISVAPEDSQLSTLTTDDPLAQTEPAQNPPKIEENEPTAEEVKQAAEATLENTEKKADSQQNETLQEESQTNQQNTPAAVDDWIAEESNGYMVITGYEGSEENIIVPSKIGEFPVQIDLKTVLGDKLHTAIKTFEIEESKDGLSPVKLTGTFHSLFLKNDNPVTAISFADADVTAITDMTNMFRLCSNLDSLDISSWDTQNVVYMNGMFRGCSRLESLDLSNWNTQNVVQMIRVFEGCSSLQSLNLSNWNTQNVQNMTGMFHGCSSLESLDLSNWNTQNAVSMNHMFYSCSKLTELKLSKSFQLDSIQQLRDLPSSENDGKTNYHWVKDDAAEIYNSTDQLIEQHNNLSDDEVHTYTIQRSHEVSFVTNNGDDQLPTQKVLEGKFAQAPNYTGTKDHHQFEGWMLNEQKFDFEQMGITEPTTLSANWRLNQYTIRFNENGGTGTMASQILSYDEKQPLIQNAFERIGYSFKGWSTTENGQDGENFADQAEVKNLSMVDGESIDLYAQWEANQYNVIFDRNGGSGVLNPQQMTYDLATGLSENEFTRKGYSFTGWNTQADGTGTSYLDKEEVNNLVAEPNGSITLFAQWDMTKYNVTFDSAGGSTVPEQSYTMETGLTDFATPTRNGFMFLGWYDGETKVEAIEAGETGDRTLTAKWEIIEYTITFDDDLIQPITYTIESDALKLPTKERIGYTFLGWLVSEDTIQRAGTEPGETVQEIQSGTTGNLRLSAQWEANQYSINFDSNGGSGELAPQQLTYDLAVTLSENKFTRPGYSFIGWNSQVDGTGTAYSDKQEVENLVTESNGSITLFAQWEANKSALEDLVNEEKQNPRDKEDYTAESWKNYEEALAQAKKVLADDQATAEQIATALEELKTAIANLELLKTSDGQIIGTANDSTTTRKSYPSAGTQAKSFPQTGMIAGSGMMIAGIAVVGAALAGWKKRKKK